MQKSRRKIYNSAFTLCSITVMIIIGIVAYGGLSLGWFSQNRVVNAHGMEIALYHEDPTKATVTFYDATAVDDGVITFDMSHPKTTAALPEYDLLQDKTHYLLMQVHLDVTEPEPFTVTVSTNTTYRLDKNRPLILDKSGTGGNYTYTYTDDNGETQTVTMPYSNWLSSILFFEQVTVSDTGVVTLKADESDRYSFVDKSTSDYPFLNTATTPYTIPFTATADEKDLYLVIGYDNDLVSKLFSENIGISQAITYVNDCKFSITLGGAS